MPSYPAALPDVMGTRMPLTAVVSKVPSVFFEVGVRSRQLQPRGLVAQFALPVSTCVFRSPVPWHGAMLVANVDTEVVTKPVIDFWNLLFLLPRCVSSPLSLNLTTKPVVVAADPAHE